MNIENPFKLGDRVFHWKYGWVRVSVFGFENQLFVQTVFNGYLWLPFPELSFTEYDLVNGGLSHERPISLPEKGQVVYVRDDEDDHWRMEFYSHYEDGRHFTSIDQDREEYPVTWYYLKTENPLLK